MRSSVQNQPTIWNWNFPTHRMIFHYCLLYFCLHPSWILIQYQKRARWRFRNQLSFMAKDLVFTLCPVALSVSAESPCLPCMPHNKVLKIHQSKSDSIWASLWGSFFIWLILYNFLYWKFVQYDKIHFFVHFLDCEFVFLINTINRRPWSKRN